jgi:hypothetical protein
VIRIDPPRRPLDRPRWPLGWFVVRVAIVLGITWLLVAPTGVQDGGDALMRGHYYRLRGERATLQGVILVALDDTTVKAWGSPPWRSERFAAAFDTIKRARPKAIGILDPVVRLLPSGSLSTAGIVVPSTTAGDDPMFEPRSGVVEHIPLRADPSNGSIVADVLEAAGITLEREELAINFVGARGLPTLSAEQVARGDIPNDAFRDRIVVFGLTARAYAGQLATPFGVMAPAQVRAQALLTVTDDAIRGTLPAWARWLLVAVLCIAVMLMVHARHVIATFGPVTLVIGIVAADYLLFSSNIAELGSTCFVFGLVVASTVGRISERIAIHGALEAIGRWTRQRMAFDALRTGVPDRGAFHHQVSQLTRLYLGSSSTFVLELPPGSTRLALPDEGVAERRGDIRRDPWRHAHLTQSPIWHHRFMASGLELSTLLVPIMTRGRLLGFWIVNFPAHSQLAAPHIELIKTLAREIGTVIDRRRAQAKAQHDLGPLDRLLGTSRVTLDLLNIQQSVQWQTENQQDLLALGENMPFGVAVATLWGEVRYVNSTMKGLQGLGGDQPSDDAMLSLSELLIALTQQPADVVNHRLRKLVQELDVVELPGPTHDVTISWLKQSANQGGSEQLLIVCAIPRRAGHDSPARARVSAAKATTPPPSKHPMNPLVALNALVARHQPPGEDAVTVPVSLGDLDDEELRLEPPKGVTAAKGTDPRSRDLDDHNPLHPRAGTLRPLPVVPPVRMDRVNEEQHSTLRGGELAPVSDPTLD